MARLTKYGQYEHGHTILGNVVDRQGGVDYLSMSQLRPATVTIYNVATTNGNWTAVATGLTGVLKWRLSEAAGADFNFAFVPAPSASATAFGWVAEDTDISAIYVQRKTATNLNAELVVWSA